MRRLAVTGVALAALAASGSGCGGSSGYGGGSNNPPPTCTAADATPTTSVSLANMAFAPSCVKIAVGATLTFHNADSVTHTVTTDAGQPETFDSNDLPPGQVFMHQFMAAETVHVHCKIHPYMTATIIVQ